LNFISFLLVRFSINICQRANIRDESRGFNIRVLPILWQGFFVFIFPHDEDISATFPRLSLDVSLYAIAHVKKIYLEISTATRKNGNLSSPSAEDVSAIFLGELY
jgi:hypothetical protein